MNPSTLCRFRKRVGQEGISLMEDEVFTTLQRADVIEADMMLMDATVLDSPIIYPTDVRLRKYSAIPSYPSEKNGTFHKKLI